MKSLLSFGVFKVRLVTKNLKIGECAGLDGKARTEQQ
jgi:hypothetical protein